MPNYFIVCKLQEFEKYAAQVDGGKVELLKLLNIHKMNMDNIMDAEEHAEELNRQATEFEQWVTSLCTVPEYFHFVPFKKKKKKGIYFFSH